MTGTLHVAQAEDLYRVLVKDADIPVMIFSADTGLMLDANDLSLDLFGYSLDELKSKGPWDLSPERQGDEETMAKARQYIENSMQGRVEVFDWVHLNAHGEEFPCRISLLRFPPFDQRILRATVLDMSGQREIEKALDESEFRFQSVFDQQLHVSALLDNQGKIVHLNKVAQMLMLHEGEKEIDYKGNFYWNLKLWLGNSDLRQQIKTNIQKVIETAEPLESVDRMQTVQGKTVYGRVFVHPITDQNDMVKYVLIQGIDETKQVEMQKAVIDSEKRLESIIRDQSEMIVRWLPGGIRTFVNQAYCKCFNLSPEEAIGTSFYPLISEKVKEEIRVKLKSTSPNNPVITVTHEVLLPDGSKGWHEWCNRGFFDENGQVLYYQGVGRDITERIDYQQALATSERNLNAVIDNAFDIVVSINRNYEILTLNRIGSEALGKHAKKEVRSGMNLLDLIPEELAKLWKPRFDRALTGERFIVEDKTDNGKCPKYTEVALNPIEENNEVLGVSIIARDVTQRRTQEEQIRAQKERLSKIYDNTKDFMSLIRVEGDSYIIESVNEAFVQANISRGIEMSVDELIGQHVGHFHNKYWNMTLEESEARLARLRQVGMGNEPLQFYEEVSIAGAELCGEGRFTPIRVNDELTHILCVWHDVTQAKKDEEKLRKAYDEVHSLKSRLEQENVYLRKERELEHNFESMVFASNKMERVLADVEQVAKSNATILITGETGTGKELIAHSIHGLSGRVDRPMIKVNCAALPFELIESELFGHEKGAFTGATEAKPGRFELAHGGTLFLDEIGDMPVNVQVKLLRVLQEGEFERLGATQSISVDVRIVAATSRDLQTAVKEGRFREDLFFRLNVVPIHLPALRERPEDIPILVEHFTHKYNAKHGKDIKFITDERLCNLSSYAWPGNVRELENTIERAVLLSQGEDLMIGEASPEESRMSISVQNQTLDQIQKAHIQRVLKVVNGIIEGKGGAAEILGIKPSTLRDRMARLGINRQ